MEEITRFTKSTEQKFEELEVTLQKVSGKSNVSYKKNENSPLLLEILYNHLSNLEKELIEKDGAINFLLMQKNESNNIRSVNKTVTENKKLHKRKDSRETG